MGLIVRAAPIPRIASVKEQRHVDRVTWWLVYVAALAGTLLLGSLAVVGGGHPFSLSLLILLMAMAVGLARPKAGLFVLVTVAMIGDPVITPWYPVNKNLSSVESVLYINDRTILSPLELLLISVLVGWIVQMYTTRRWEIRRGRLLTPLLVFTGFVLIGFLQGIARGGSINIGLWEARPLFYLPLVYLLVINLLRESFEYERLVWCIVGAVVLNALIAFGDYQAMTPAQREDIESLVAHGTTLPMNMLFLLAIGAWLFRGSFAMRVTLPILAVPVLVVYLVSERRSAVVGLVAALAVMAIALYWTSRRRFWMIVPAAVLVGTAYVGAFWNATGPLAVPALAAKSVIAPDSLDEKDWSSNLYRRVENADVVYTLRSTSYLGVGFGREFAKPYPLPFISPFLLADYMPHNSILWLWLKTGVAGFVAFLYLVGATMRRGARAVLSTARTREGPVVIALLGFIVGYLVFAYVDIAWDAQNVLLIGIALAYLDLVASRPEPVETPISDAWDDDDLDEPADHAPSRGGQPVPV